MREPGALLSIAIEGAVTLLAAREPTSVLEHASTVGVVHIGCHDTNMEVFDG